MVLKVGLCSLYAARATNLLTRAEPMQRRILDWGREVVAVFREGGENSTREGEPQYERLTTSTTASQSIAPIFNGIIQKTLLPTFRNELARQAQYPHGHSPLPYPLQQPSEQT